MTVCSFCTGTGKRTVWWLERGEYKSRLEKCEYCDCFTKGAPCPYAKWHGPDEVVHISESKMAHRADGRMETKRKDWIIRYADDPFRCRVCYPRPGIGSPDSKIR